MIVALTSSIYSEWYDVIGPPICTFRDDRQSPDIFTSTTTLKYAGMTEKLKCTYVRNRSVPLNVQRKGKSEKSIKLKKKQLQNQIRLIYLTRLVF